MIKHEIFYDILYILQLCYFKALNFILNKRRPDVVQYPTSGEFELKE